MAKYNNAQILPYDDDCACISKLLSVKDKLIYLVVRATLGDFVVPLIHSHVCIEYIYIYQDCDDVESIYWRQDYPKIRGNECSIDLLTEQVTKDIDSIMKRPSRWSRSRALLMELCFQASRTNISLPIHKVTDNDLGKWRIVVLYLNLRRSFHLSHSKIRINEFYNMEECIRSIKTEQISVFLIISMEGFNNIQPVAELHTIHAIYIISDLKYEEQIEMLSMHSKLSGIFVLNEDFLEQLTTDICFYRQIQVRIPATSVFKIESNILDKLTETQKDFLCFQLFSEILSQLPVQSTTVDDNDIINSNQLLSHLIEANIKITYLFNQFDISTLRRSITELSNINRQVLSIAKNVNSSSVMVYRAQLVPKKDIEMIKENLNALFTIHAFVLASRSFQSVAEICRQVTDNQLTIILFEIKLSDKVSVVYVNSDLVVFKLGTLFRLVSIGSASDNVWRAQLEISDSAMQRIKDQLQVEIGGHLTWLTFGNYLTSFKRSSDAQNYYEYLLELISSEHPSLASIYNNMGLMYSEKKDNKTALELYKKALEAKVLEPSVTVKQKNLSISDLSSPRSTPTDRILILTKIAEIHCRQGNRNKSIEYFRQALEITTDATSRQFYQARIEALLSSDNNL